MNTLNESVKTAARTLDLFEAFAGAQAAMTLTEIAARIELPVSSCHALIRTLQARGYLYVRSGRRRCYPTRKLLEIATAIARHDPIAATLRPLLEKLRDTTRETVILGKRHVDRVIYLDVIEGLETVRYVAHAGETKPLHSSAIGKAMLSTLPPAEFQAFLQSGALPRITASTITDPGALTRDIETARRRKYFTTMGENVADVGAIAVVRQVDGEAVGIALAAPTSRIRQNKDEYLKALMNTLDQDLLTD